MACELERPDAQALFTRYQQMFQNTVLGGATTIEESNEWYAISMNYAMAEEFYAIAEQVKKERDPRAQCVDNLIADAARDGVYPLPAQPAQGYLKLTGTANAALPAPLEFTVDGVDYITAVDANQPTTLDANGEVVIRVRAVTPGEVGNITAATGTLNTTVADVDTDVEVCGGSFCIGQDAELPETFRQRYLRRLSYHPRANNQWVRDKILEWPCVTRVINQGGSCCSCSCGGAQTGSASGGCTDCGCVDCGGSMRFYVMFDGSFTNGIAPSYILDEIQTWLFGSPQGYGLGQVPMGICGQIIQPTAVEVNAVVDINDCATATQLASIREIVNEFFTTVEPSQPLSSEDLRITILRTISTVTDVTVSFELVDPSLGYGFVTGVSQSDTSAVYITPCGLEPDCDYVLALNDLTISTNSETVSGCPSVT